MNLFDFIERFPGENDCLEYFIAIRQKAGVVCQKCGCEKHDWLASTDQFECTKCKNHISLKSGTAMENSKLPIKYWFIAIYLITSTTEIFTIKEIQEKLSGADRSQINEMLNSLNLLIIEAENSMSFDQLLASCVKSKILKINLVKPRL